ncbi:MAG: right-handed parallel beta-helix repeat-containing protein [Candidatus Bathyarchaeia archaeon]
MSIVATALVEASPVKDSKIVYASSDEESWRDRAVIRILANGTVTPWTPNIFVSSDYSKYTFQGDLYIPTGINKVAILVERDNIIIDGNGYTLEGNKSYGSIGIKMYFPEDLLPSELPNGVGSVTIKNLTITKFNYGIDLDFSSQNSIIGNTIEDDGVGIYMDHDSSYNNVSGNTIKDGGLGIYIKDIGEYDWDGDGVNEYYYSLGNNVMENTIVGNLDGGIQLEYCKDSNIIRNTIASNVGGVGWEHGISACDSNNISIIGNIVAEHSGFGIALTNLNDSSISNNLITDNMHGIYLESAENNRISNNTIISNCHAGIWLDSRSNYNNIIGNTIEDNEKGIWLYDSYGYGEPSENVIFHNNFYDNYEQVKMETWCANVFDDGYPSGGNHWSHYSVADVKSGPNQDIDRSDGICDLPFTIYDAPEDTEDIRDDYPLAAPINTVDAGTFGGTTYGVDIVSNSTVSHLQFIPYIVPPYISFDVTGDEGTIGFCRITIPKDLLWAETDRWVVLINGEPVNYTVFSDPENTYLYFVYNHSTHKIEIRGTQAIPEFTSLLILPLFMITTTLVAVYKRKRRLR